MIFDEPVYSINSFHPSFGGGTSQYNFHIGLKKEFAQKALEIELPEQGIMSFKKFAENVLKQEGLKGFSGENYDFFKHKSGKNSCLLHHVEVPGINSCHLVADFNQVDNLYKVSEYNKFLEYHPHNIDNARQAHGLLSLFNYWANSIRCLVKDKT